MLSRDVGVFSGGKNCIRKLLESRALCPVEEVDSYSEEISQKGRGKKEERKIKKLDDQSRRP